jgi:hypothetical protein
VLDPPEPLAVDPVEPVVLEPVELEPVAPVPDIELEEGDIVAVICTLWLTCWLRSTELDAAMSRYSSAALEPMLDEPVWLPELELGLEELEVLDPPEADPVLPADPELPVEPALDEPEAPLRSTFVSLYIALLPLALELLLVELPLVLAVDESRSTQPVNETVCPWLLVDEVLPDWRLPLWLLPLWLLGVVDDGVWLWALTPTRAHAAAIETAVTVRFMSSSSRSCLLGVFQCPRANAAAGMDPASAAKKDTPLVKKNV